jgi:FkbM family methyltransferase
LFGPKPVITINSLHLKFLKTFSCIHSFKKKLLRSWYSKRIIRFYENFIHPGELIFDVGANVGERTALFLQIGARVVAIEPHPQCVKLLNQRFGQKATAVLNVALGRKAGVQTLYVSDVRSPISSMSSDWISAVKESGRFRNYTWSKAIDVRLTTLDELIGNFGVPGFCKIDVEGFEVEVLKGLSIPLKLLSFEFHSEYLPNLLSCITILDELGSYEYNYVLGNFGYCFDLNEWVNREQVLQSISLLKAPYFHGDMYARCKQ